MERDKRRETRTERQAAGACARPANLNQARLQFLFDIKAVTGQKSGLSGCISMICDFGGRFFENPKSVAFVAGPRPSTSEVRRSDALASPRLLKCLTPVSLAILPMLLSDESLRVVSCQLPVSAVVSLKTGN